MERLGIKRIQTIESLAREFGRIELDGVEKWEAVEDVKDEGTRKKVKKGSKINKTQIKNDERIQMMM